MALGTMGGRNPFGQNGEAAPRRSVFDEGVDGDRRRILLDGVHELA